MSTEINILIATAVSIGFIHTVLGPDHYLPFIVMAKSQRWSLLKTSVITALCGLGHVLSSVVIGLFGAGLGLAVERLSGWEAARGNLAAWALIAFGLLYAIYGIRVALRGQTHTHRHLHTDGTEHDHEHRHIGEHTHVHTEPAPRASMTPWILFIVFVLGPCEPLIPLLMFPALEHSTMGMIIVAAAFSLTTIITMLAAVLIGSFGLGFVPLGKLERYSHIMAGLIIFMSGAAIQFLGL